MLQPHVRDSPVVPLWAKQGKKKSSGGPGRAEPDKAPEAADAGGGRKIVCKVCRAKVTEAGERMEKSGKHAHVFCNPHGIVFEIGCFARCPGCVGVGPSSTEFTWFPGHAWRVVVCAACHSHLGWRFVSNADRSGFHGLILDMLAEEDESDKPGGR